MSFRLFILLRRLQKKSGVLSVSAILLAALPPAPVLAHNLPLAGRWENNDGKFVLIYLADGRTASSDQRPYVSPGIRMEIGTFQVTGDSVRHAWLLSGPEVVKITAGENTMTINGTNTLRKTANATEAVAAYETIYESIKSVAAQARKNVPTGMAVKEKLHVSAMIPDKLAGQIFDGATVFAQTARFQWVLTPVHQYEVRNPDEPGLTCCSYTFLPNGRFCFDGWLYGVLVDDKVPFDERSPAEVRGREVPVRHQQYWGRYRIVPGKEALDPDSIELITDSGLRKTESVIDGRLYMTTSDPRLLFSNYAEVKKYNQQRLQK